MGNDHTLPTAQLSESERDLYERERSHLPSLHVASFLGEEAKIRGDRRLQARDVNKRSKMGRTALHYASIRGHESIIRLLIQRNATVNVRDVDGKTPLAVTVDGGFYGCQELLVESGAVVNLHDNEQRTPLHLASVQGDLRTVGLLLDNGARMDMQDSTGLTALALARAAGHRDVCSRLERNTAGEDVPDTSEPPAFSAVLAGSPVDGDYMRKMAEQSQQRQKEAVKRLRRKREELDRKREQVDEEVRQLQRHAETEEKRVQDTKAETELRREQLTREIELQHRNLALEEELESKTREHEVRLENELKAQGLRFSDEMRRQKEQEEEKQHQWQEKMDDDLKRRRQEIDDHRVAMEERLERQFSELEISRRELTAEQKQKRDEIEEERRCERAGWEQEKQQHSKQMEKKRQKLDERQRELEAKYQEKVEQHQEHLRAKLEELRVRENTIRAELESKYLDMQRTLEEEKQQLLSKREQLEQEFGQKLSLKESEMRQLMDGEWERVRAMEDKLEDRRLEVEGRLVQRQGELDRLRESLQKKFDNERNDLVAKVKAEHEGWSEREKQLVAALEKARFESATVRDRLAQVQIQLENESRQRGQTEERARQETDQLWSKINSLTEEREKEQLKQQEALKQKDAEYATREREWLKEQQRRADEMKKREAEILQRRQELESERHQLEHRYYENWMKRRLAVEEQHLEVGTTISEDKQPDRGPYFDLPDPTRPIRRRVVPQQHSSSELANQREAPHLEELQTSLEQMLTNYTGAVGQWKAEVTRQLEKTQEDSQRRDDLQRLERSWGEFEHRVSSMISEMRRESEQQKQQKSLNVGSESAVESENVVVSALQEKVSLLDYQLSSEQSHVAELMDQLSNQERRIDELQVTRDLQRVEESLERVLDQSKLVHSEIERQNRMIDQRNDDSLQMTLHALSPTPQVQSPEAHFVGGRQKTDTLRQPRTSTPTNQTADAMMEREKQRSSGRDSGIALTDGRTITSSKDGKTFKHVTSSTKRKAESADLEPRTDTVQKQSTQLTSILKHKQPDKYLGNKKISSRFVDKRDIAVSDIDARDSRQQEDQEETESSGDESGSDMELKAVFTGGSPSPEPQGFGQQGSRECASVARVSPVIHQRPLSSSPPRSALLGKFYLGASAAQTRPVSATGYSQFHSTTRPSSEASGKLWQPRRSLQGHRHVSQPSSLSVEDNLTDQKYEIQKLRFQLAQEKEERETADMLLQSTKDRLGAARGRLLREQMLHSATVLDCDHLHHTVHEMSHATNKSADEFALLKQLLNSSQPA